MHPDPDSPIGCTVPTGLHDAITRLVAESDRAVRSYEVADLGFGLKSVAVLYTEFRRGETGNQPVTVFVFASISTNGSPVWEAVHRQEMRG